MPNRRSFLIPVDTWTRKKLFCKHKQFLKNARCRINLKPVRMMANTFLRVDRLKLDYLASKRILNDNITLLTKINNIQRNRGFTNNYNEAKGVWPTGYHRSCQRVREIEKANFKFGCRLLAMRSSLYSRLNSGVSREAEMRTLKENTFVIPANIMRKYSALISTQETSMWYKLLRPKIFIDLYVKNIRPLGRIIIQLYTEACPALVLQFVRLCHSQASAQWKFIRIFPILWIEGELVVPKDTLTEPGFEYNMNTLDHGHGSGILSFAKSYTLGFPEGLLNFSISFKELPVLNGERIPFGIVTNGLKVLDCLQDYGTKNGKTKKTIEVVNCGITSS